jgi:hypothetical protein
MLGSSARLDLLRALYNQQEAVETASGVLRALGLTPGVVRAADLAGGPLVAINNK